MGHNFLLMDAPYRKHDKDKKGKYRTKRVILEIYAEMAYFRNLLSKAKLNFPITLLSIMPSPKVFPFQEKRKIAVALNYFQIYC